jgi:AraC-like DNA-binding protein
MSIMRANSPHPVTDGMAWSGFDRLVERCPGGAQAVFDTIGVPLSVIDRPGITVPFSQYVDFFTVAAALSGNSDFGHWFGLQTRAARSGIPGQLILNARQFRQGILDLARTLPTLCQGLHIELVEDRDPPAIIWAIAPCSSDSTQFLYFANAYLVRMLQAHRGSQWHPRRIFYSAPAARRLRLYESHLSCPTVFQAPINAIELERRDLRAIKHGVDKHVYALLTTYAEYLLSKEPHPRNMPEVVNLAICDGLTSGCCNIGFVARRLKISTRSLRRMMNASGASFSALRDQARMDLAKSLLADLTLTISEVAYRVGYSEIAAFTHAFTNYFGTSPRQFRLDSGLSTERSS